MIASQTIVQLVIVWLSDESGNIAAHYEYSPFGSLAKVTGDYAGNNPFRFSSEYFDEETGLVYYNYRYYDPELGRWISRDPIEEQGGNNLYIFVNNNPVLFTDFNGLWERFAGSLVSPSEAQQRAELSRRGINPDNPTSHFSRDAYNNEPPSVDAAREQGYSQMSKRESRYHQQGIGGEGNTKWISPDGHHEAVYDKNGHLVTDNINRGTYNYSPPSSGVEHFFNDMIPYFLYGNNPGDPTDWKSVWERITGTYEGPLPPCPQCGK